MGAGACWRLAAGWLAGLSRAAGGLLAATMSSERCMMTDWVVTDRLAAQPCPACQLLTATTSIPVDRPRCEKMRRS